VAPNPVEVAFLTNPLMYSATLSAVAKHRDRAAATPVGEMLPGAVRAWMARVRLLEGVPFAHLVPDAELLPLESIRFFYLDREWTDALLQGVLSVGSVTNLDREQLQSLHKLIRDEVDTEERQVRLVGSDAPGRAPADTITGFLLRSRAVSGWPALHVRGYSDEIGRDDAPVAEDDPRRLRLLRLERLAPAVLLCLFDGVPRVVHLEEPRQGIQFGVDLAANASGTWGATIPLRDVTTARRLDETVPTPPGDLTGRVPFRRGGPGVVHVAELAKRIAAQPATKVDQFDGAGVQSGEFAMEMLQFPFRQVFGDPNLGTVPGGTPLAYDQLFRPTVSIETVRAWNAHPAP
jgi:hypothetical protein